MRYTVRTVTADAQAYRGYVTLVRSNASNRFADLIVTDTRQGRFDRAELRTTPDEMDELAAHLTTQARLMRAAQKRHERSLARSV
jgi:RecA/RadA recombinase